MNFKKIFSIFLAIVMLLGIVSFPAFSADSTHSLLTHLDGFSLIETDLAIRSFSDLHRLFDGDSTASHANTTPAQSPDGNGLFGDNWKNSGDTNYIVFDLGDVYDLSQINTYWGWAPQAQPSWNNWEYDVPSSYSIYVANTREELKTASAVKTVSGLSKGSKFLANSTATFTATGRYVKIVSTYGAGGHYALRELEFYGARKPAVTLMGANIRLETYDLPAGLRFGAKLDKTLLGIEGDWTYGDASGIEFGMYLLPTNIITEGKTFVDYLNSGGQEIALKVPAKKILSQNDTYITYTAVLIDIPESDFGRAIAAVPYVTKNGETTYYNETAKSYIDVALAAINSYENGNPNNITLDQYNELKIIVGDTENEEPEVALEYYDIDAAAQAKGYRNNSTLPASIFVDLGTTYAGYKIDGTYKLDANTLRMLTTVSCVGNGTVKYKDYNNFTDYIADKSYGLGYGKHCYGEQIVAAPVSKLSDPIYMSMVLPSEGSTYMNVQNPYDPRNNGNNMHAVCTVANCTQCNKVEYIRLNTLGAVYLNQDKKSELENYKDVQFKLCLGNIRLLIYTASGGWQQVKIDATPTSGNGSLYCLPWQLEWNTATSQTYLSNCKSLTGVSRKTNYSEIPLKVSDFFFSKTFTGTDSQSYTIDERVLHFWGSQYNISNDDAILGVIASYDMWIEYDKSIGINLEDYFISSIGADWRYSNGSGGTVTRQAFAGYKHAVSTEKTTVFGHNMGPSYYDTYMSGNALASVMNVLGIN